MVRNHCDLVMVGPLKLHNQAEIIKKSICNRETVGHKRGINGATLNYSYSGDYLARG